MQRERSKSFKVSAERRDELVDDKGKTRDKAKEVGGWLWEPKSSRQCFWGALGMKRMAAGTNDSVALRGQHTSNKTS